jgi:hypothetical protein
VLEDRCCHAITAELRGCRCDGEVSRPVVKSVLISVLDQQFNCSTTLMGDFFVVAVVAELIFRIAMASVDYIEISESGAINCVFSMCAPFFIIRN